MIQLKSIFIIFKKEFIESFRDRKTLLTNYGIPLVIYPLFLIFSGEALSTHLTKIKNEKHSVYVLGDQPPGIASKFREAKKIDIPTLAPATEKDLAQTVQSLETLPVPPEKGPDPKQEERLALKTKILKVMKEANLKALLTFQKTDAEKLYVSKIYFDNTHQLSTWVADYLKTEVSRSIAQLRTQKLKSIGLRNEVVMPFSYGVEGLEDSNQSLGKVVGSFATYLAFIVLSLSAFYPALNSTVGEREIGTLSTLLGTSIRIPTLIYGKFLGVLLASLAGISTYLVSSLICSFLFAGGIKTRFSLEWIGVPFLLLLSAASLISAATLCLGFISKKKTEGQAFLSFLMLAVLAPAVIVMWADLPSSPLLACVPLLNLALASKYFAAGIAPASFLGLAMTVNLIYTYGLLKLSCETLKSEYSADASFSDLLNFDRKLIRFTTPALSMFVFLAVLSSSLYLNFIFARASIFLVSPVTQLLAFLLIPIGISKYYNLNLKESFHLNRPSVLSLISGTLIALSAPIVLLSLLPMDSAPKELVEELEKRFHLHDPQTSLISLIFATAVLPGICEEIAYRGIILSGLLRRFSPFWSVLISSVLFGINHFSLSRFMPTVFTGALLAFSVSKSRSVYTSMLIHILYNSVLIIFSRNGQWAVQFSGVFLLIPILILVSGLTLAHIGRKPSTF